MTDYQNYQGKTVTARTRTGETYTGRVIKDEWCTVIILYGTYNNAKTVRIHKNYITEVA